MPIFISIFNTPLLAAGLPLSSLTPWRERVRVRGIKRVFPYDTPPACGGELHSAEQQPYMRKGRYFSREPQLTVTICEPPGPFTETRTGLPS